MQTKITKRAARWQAQFAKTMTAYLAGVGAKPNSYNPPEHTLLTRAGTLTVTVYENWLACRFLDIQHAKRYLGDRTKDRDSRLNPHSGKWNFHFTTGTDLDICEATFRSELEPLLY
jgi:hypothetical protein